jgi:hypothetical protein
MKQVFVILFVFGCKPTISEMTKENTIRKKQLQDSIKMNDLTAKFIVKMSEDRLRELEDTLAAQRLLDSSKYYFTEALRMKEELKAVELLLDSLSKLER